MGASGDVTAFTATAGDIRLSDGLLSASRRAAAAAVHRSRSTCVETRGTGAPAHWRNRASGVCVKKKRDGSVSHKIEHTLIGRDQINHGVFFFLFLFLGYPERGRSQVRVGAEQFSQRAQGRGGRQSRQHVRREHVIIALVLVLVLVRLRRLNDEQRR